jgi:hypothetical protein
MKTRLINTKCLLQPLVVASFILCSAASADVITDWNTTTLITTLAEPPQSEWRVMSMTHGAMFDAVNAITRTHAAYLIQPKAAQGSSIEAAAASAAHGVLIALYPAQKAPSCLMAGVKTVGWPWAERWQKNMLLRVPTMAHTGRWHTTPATRAGSGGPRPQLWRRFRRYFGQM